MFQNALVSNFNATDGTGDSLRAVFTDEGHVWVYTTDGQVVDLDPSQVADLTAFLIDGAQTTS